MKPSPLRVWWLQYFNWWENITYYLAQDDIGREQLKREIGI